MLTKSQWVLRVRANIPDPQEGDLTMEGEVQIKLGRDQIHVPTIAKGTIEIVVASIDRRVPTAAEQQVPQVMMETIAVVHMQWNRDKIPTIVRGMVEMVVT